MIEAISASSSAYDVSMTQAMPGSRRSDLAADLDAAAVGQPDIENGDVRLARPESGPGPRPPCRPHPRRRCPGPASSRARRARADDLVVVEEEHAQGHGRHLRIQAKRLRLAGRGRSAPLDKLTAVPSAALCTSATRHGTPGTSVPAGPTPTWRVQSNERNSIGNRPDRRRLRRLGLFDRSPRLGRPPGRRSPTATLELVMTWEWPNSYGWAVPIPDDFDPESDVRKVLDTAVAGSAGRASRTSRWNPG